MDLDATVQLLDDMAVRAVRGDVLLVAADVMVALLDFGLVVEPDSGDRHPRYRGGTRIRTAKALPAGGVALQAAGRVIAPTAADDSWVEREFLRKSGPAGSRPARPPAADLEAARRLYPPVAGAAPAAPRKRQRHVDI